MAVRVVLLVVSIYFLALTHPVAAQNEFRSTNDGVLTVEVPDPAKFDPMTPPPPSYQYGWEAKDGSMRLAMRHVYIGMKTYLQEDAETAFESEFGAPAQRLPDRKAGEYQIWSMRFDLDNGNVARVDMFRLRGELYQLFGVWPQGEEMPADVDDFFNSIRIAQAVPAADTGSAGPQDIGEEQLVNGLSRMIGGCSCMLLFVALLAGGIIYIVKVTTAKKR